MELVDVLRHQEQPRSEYFLEMPTPYGKLRLDIQAPVEVALTQTGLSEEDERAVDQIIDRSAQARQRGDTQESIDLLLDAAKQYPYGTPLYKLLYAIYQPSNPAEAEYYLKQVIALEPVPDNLLELGKLLGQMGRLEEAATLQSYLWQSRAQLKPEVALDAAKDYLVTLGRMVNPEAMIKVAGQAVSELGGETSLVYQYIFAHLLNNQVQEASEMLDSVLPKLNPDERLYPKFVQLRDHIAGLLQKS